MQMLFFCTELYLTKLFTISFISNLSDTAWSSMRIAIWFNIFCPIVNRKYVLSWRIALNDLLVDAVVTGTMCRSSWLVLSFTNGILISLIVVKGLFFCQVISPCRSSNYLRRTSAISAMLYYLNNFRWQLRRSYFHCIQQLIQ